MRSSCSRPGSSASTNAWRKPPATSGPRSEERRVGKECRSLCDWSSDVCSSDLIGHVVIFLPYAILVLAPRIERIDERLEEAARDLGAKIGRASCRERV